MRPRSFASRKCRRRCVRSCRNSGRFNEAAMFRSRKFDAFACMPLVRASMRPRSLIAEMQLRVESQSASSISFNEAAIVDRGNARDGHAARPMRRRFNEAAMFDRGNLCARQLASTHGLQCFNEAAIVAIAEMSQLTGCRSKALSASMRPRSSDRGNQASHATDTRCNRGFNEAAIV